MDNEEIYKAFRSQKEYFKFGEFLENCIEFIYEEEECELNLNLFTVEKEM